MTTLLLCLLLVNGYLPAEPYNTKALLSVLVLETRCGDYNKESSAGALGIAQIMPTTGAWLWKKCEEPGDFATTKLLDDTTSIRLADCYLRLLHQQYRSWALAAAAYNGGNRTAMKLKATKPVNSETANYVARFFYLMEGDTGL